MVQLDLAVTQQRPSEGPVFEEIQIMLTLQDVVSKAVRHGCDIGGETCRLHLFDICLGQKLQTVAGGVSRELVIAIHNLTNMP